MQRPAEAADARVVYQNVNMGGGSLDPAGQGLDRGELADVTFDRFALSAFLDDPLRRALQGGERAPADDGGGAQEGQLAGHRCPDAPPSSGHHCHLAVQGCVSFTGHRPSFKKVAWPRGDSAGV